MAPDRFRSVSRRISNRGGLLDGFINDVNLNALEAQRRATLQLRELRLRDGCRKIPGGISHNLIKLPCWKCVFELIYGRCKRHGRL